MLDEALGANHNLAWLREGLEQHQLQVRQWSASPDKESLSFYAPNFALSRPEPWLVGEALPPLCLQALQLPALSHRVEPQAAPFARVHEDILSRIDKGEFQKVVPIVCEELEFERELRVEMFPSVTSPAATVNQKNQFSYGFAFADEGLVGVTPELLFEVDGEVLKTMALAGTGPVDGPDLLQDPKEVREHKIVVEHILKELADWGVCEVGTTVERAYGVLKHLYTPITLKFDLIKQPSFTELVARLHPTAALGGWPRAAAVRWLESQEFHFGRGRFGAPFGFKKGDHCKAVVAIRCLQWQGRRANVCVGCGVVEGSKALNEWRELALKREAIYHHLRLPVS